MNHDEHLNESLDRLTSFHEAAKGALLEYASLARDIGRTLPKSEWPTWARNSLRKQELLDENGDFRFDSPLSFDIAL